MTWDDSVFRRIEEIQNMPPEHFEEWHAKETAEILEAHQRVLGYLEGVIIALRADPVSDLIGPHETAMAVLKTHMRSLKTYIKEKEHG